MANIVTYVYTTIIPVTILRASPLCLHLRFLGNSVHHRMKFAFYRACVPFPRGSSYLLRVLW
uniref:Uncharacterized protein n=1 Tax=Babesia bovis TaxID=5865 RepID=S6B424_BABBO|nr:hypothetical protein [Babesia bovis]